MAHFAKLGINSKVIGVEVVADADCKNADGNEDESVGIQFLERIHGWPLWKRTSYNTTANVHTKGGTPFRKNYAAIGYTYDEDNDIFWPPKPYDSWVKDIPNAKWKSPIGDKPVPESDEFLYLWNEDNQTWDKISKNG
jgi:hypothetical protein